MQINKENYLQLVKDVSTVNARLVAVSKMKPIEAIKEFYDLGHRDFGENYVQELTDKQSQLPADIRWHFIGHLQSNKVKYIAPFVYLIHGVDSYKLLREINKQASKFQRTINVLLQVHIAEEETKFGLDEKELEEILQSEPVTELPNVKIVGLMGMASFTEDQNKVRGEFRKLKQIFDRYSQLEILSMGMSGDYKIALEEGSTMVRIGSLLFGSRQ